MIVELTEQERSTDDPFGPDGYTLAWRAFGKLIGVQAHDPIFPIDGGSSQFEPITGRWFDFKKPKATASFLWAIMGAGMGVACDLCPPYHLRVVQPGP